MLGREVGAYNRILSWGENRMKINRVERNAFAVHDMAGHMAMQEHTLGLELDYEETISSIRLAVYPAGEISLELPQTDDHASPVAERLAGHGRSPFHLCFKVEDIGSVLAGLCETDGKLRNETPLTGHGGSPIALIEPAEQPDRHGA